MTEMNITNASLKALHLHPKWIKNVKSLSISNNNISEMEVIFETCKSIEKLDISKNRFKKLRFSSPMPSLVDLNGSENSIERVVNFYNVRKIETLNLKSNKIECLTRWVEDKKVSNKKKSSERLKPKSLEPIR
jgi:Leucine-rich repeat (LRR) protein